MVLVTTITATLGAVATPQLPQFRASADLVRLEVSVTDDQGAVRGLQAADFVVEDNGVRQTVRVEEGDDTPLDLVLVAQPLASVGYVSADQVTRDAAGLSAFLNDVEDRDRLEVWLAGTPPRLLRRLEAGRPSFGVDAFTGGLLAAPLDSIAAALRLFPRSDRRRALVAFTNADDFRSTLGFDAISDLADRPGPAFVLVGTPIRVDDEVRAREVTSAGRQIGDEVVAAVRGYVFPARLGQLAKRTGGVVVNLGSGDPRQLMAETMAWLRDRYLISYTPPADKGWHTLGVTVNRPRVKVTVREGYFVN